jgi:hypothetical protein
MFQSIKQFVSHSRWHLPPAGLLDLDRTALVLQEAFEYDFMVTHR